MAQLGTMEPHIAQGFCLTSTSSWIGKYWSSGVEEDTRVQFNLDLQHIPILYKSINL
ncbi:7099_t:CDS:2 [Funneliformis geosporum]|nr:7099_t:CDS:2 [Funneliformis geosporum]